MPNLAGTLITAALEAGKIIEQNYRKHFNVREKDGLGLVTEVDLAAEEKAISILRKAFPDFGYFAEEMTYKEGTQTQQDKMFVLDPLDGTTNFVHGFPMFCVSIAAQIHGQLEAGVIYHPILKELFVAERGKGTTLNGKKVHVSRRKELSQSLLTTGFSYLKGHKLHREVEAFERLSGVSRALRRPGSAALDLAYTSIGVFDGFWERGLSAWDVAAGILLVQEAGGEVTTFSGEILTDIHCQEIVATNALIHRDLLDTLVPPMIQFPRI